MSYISIILIYIRPCIIINYGASSGLIVSGVDSTTRPIPTASQMAHHIARRNNRENGKAYTDQPWVLIYDIATPARCIQPFGCIYLYPNIYHSK